MANVTSNLLCQFPGLTTSPGQVLLAYNAPSPQVTYTLEVNESSSLRYVTFRVRKLNLLGLSSTNIELAPYYTALRSRYNRLPLSLGCN